MIELPFQNRTTAGRLLAAELARRNLAKDSIVLALPRGGVPVGVEVAETLKAQLDVVVVRKLGVPWRPELAMGAIAGNIQVLDYQLIEQLGLSEEEVEAVVAAESEEMRRRETLYRAGHPAPDLRGRTVVLADDGLATGSTMVAAARNVRSFHPRRLIIAVPVASSEACRRLRSEADECICLAKPEPFVAVGQWYFDFRQVTDVEVEETLKCSRAPVDSGRK